MDCGYKVGVNSPYSNSETPDCDFRYQSMMLEVNKRAYLRPGTIELSNNQLRDVVSSFMCELLNR